LAVDDNVSHGRKVPGLGAGDETAVLIVGRAT